MAAGRPAGRLTRPWTALGFHLLYHPLAPLYDTVSWFVSLGHWQQWAAAGLPDLPGPHVLELGHGPGHMLTTLTDHGYRPVGLDLSAQMGRLARRRMAGRGMPLLARGRGQALPFAEQSFDGVLATFPTPYIVAPETVAGVYRLLRPGGRLVIVPEARLLGNGPLVRVVEWLYAVTGQRGDTSAEAIQFWGGRLAGSGFSVTLRHVYVNDSIVTVVIAQRPNDS